MQGLNSRLGRQSELLLGKHFPAAVGTRVIFAQRYAGDVWARDESGGRLGTVVEVMEPIKHEEAVQHTSVTVRWDRADQQKWNPNRSTSESLSQNYSGTYRCGSKGCHHLALAPDQPLPPLPSASASQLKKAAELLQEIVAQKEPLPQRLEPDKWGADLDPSDLEARPAALAYRREKVFSPATACVLCAWPIGSVFLGRYSPKNILQW